MPYTHLEMFNLLFDCTIGTLWRAKEELLKERVVNYDQESDRYCHPVLSIRRKPPASLERIPMLVGGSKKRGGPVKIKNVFKTSVPISHFGDTIAPLVVGDFLYTAPWADPGKMTGDLLEQKAVVVNSHKPRIDGNEMRQLETWMEQKGL